MSSTCCGGNCGCGDGCKCGSSCGGCKSNKMYPEMSYKEESSNANQTLVLGVAPQKSYYEDGEIGVGVENVDYKSGAGLECNP
ncbi:hypothetical protein LIER_21480 [Lithospermum erythrorhizon]|uniref:Metallothionein-like protein n=1 Tax=Lithospermum erythrorhizon TaxID=34254 RepID=A0AAV3QQE0_LITER